MKEANGGQPVESVVRWEGLSRAELIELVRLYSRLFLALDGFWYLAVKEIVGEDKANACDFWVWDKYSRYEFKRLIPLCNIKGNDLQAFATAMSFSPWISNLNCRFALEGKDRLTFTVLECPTLEALKREGMGRENTFCQQVEPQLFQIIIQSFNPKGKATPVELPPETNQADICCRWRFSIEE